MEAMEGEPLARVSGLAPGREGGKGQRLARAAGIAAKGEKKQMALERRRAEEALRASEERYRELFENASEILYTHDLAGNFTSLNKAGEQITGYSREEALRMNIADVAAPECKRLVRQMIERELDWEAPTIHQWEILTKDGRRVALDINTRLIYQDGKPVGVQGIARDVTERKQLEEQLRQAQKMEAVGRLAGGVAHDFNNLLTVIKGYSDLLLDMVGTDDRVRKAADEINKAANRAASLTRQLLAFSRQQVLQPRVLDLNTVVANVHSMLRRLIGEDIDLVTIPGAGLGRVKADPGQVEQVILNMAVNARDAMPDGGKLTITTANVELDEAYAHQHFTVRPGPYVMLAVSDTGCGMDAETRAHIFEPFFTTKEKGKGTGLGLATVYGIVKQSDGYIWVYSEPGQGTTFKIYLPRVDEAVGSLQPGSARTGPPRGSETVLLVEDEESVRVLVRDVLQRNGYNVLEVANGKEAIQLSERHPGPIHLVVTDVVMPGMSGRELARRLAIQRSDTKVLYMSGYTDDAIVHHGVLDPGTPFLEKPFTTDALARKVREVLDTPREQV